ncbi:MAG: PHP domain-containing protein, partial [Nocardioides sp.]
MSPDPFVHLHVASGYSLQYGASHPHTLVERAAEQEMDTLALTDRDGTYGAVKFVRACQAAGIRPVLGVDLALKVEPEPEPARKRRTPVRGGAFRDLPSDRGGPNRVRLLAHAGGPGGGAAGWAAICRLVSQVHL